MIAPARSRRIACNDRASALCAARIRHEFADGGSHGAVHAHAEDVSDHSRTDGRAELEHVADAADGFVEIVFLGDAVEPFGEGHQAPIAFAGSRVRREAVQLRDHPVRVLGQVEGRAILEEAPPLRVEAPEIEVVIEIAVGLGKDATQDRGKGEDRRSHVEPVAVLFEHGGFAAIPGVGFEQNDAVAPGAQGAGGRQSGEPAANDANGFGGRIFHGRDKGRGG